MENFDKNKESTYIQNFDTNNLYGWAMLKPLPVSGFKWIEKDDLSKFDEKFIKKMKIAIKDIFLRLQLCNLKNYMVNIRIYHFHLIKKLLINVKN